MIIPEAFIFDMDGTMFDTEPISAQAWRAVCAPHGWDVPESLFLRVVGMDNRSIANIFRQTFGPDFPYEDIRRQKTAWQMQYYRDHDIPLKDGLHAILAFARTHKIRCAVASSSPAVQIRFLLEKTGTISYFSYIQSGEDVAHGKPAPDIFFAACQGLGVSPSSALVLEDSRNGILAAHAAGIPTIGIPDMAAIPPDIAAMTWHMCSSLAEVPALFAEGGAL